MAMAQTQIAQYKDKQSLTLRPLCLTFLDSDQGYSQEFSKGGFTLCQSEGTHQIVMLFCHL